MDHQQQQGLQLVSDVIPPTGEVRGEIKDLSMRIIKGYLDQCPSCFNENLNKVPTLQGQ
jgi:hypothetical protein